MKSNSNGAFVVVFEGFDKTGKTHHSKKLVDLLNAVGLKTYWGSEPFGAPIFASVRRTLLDLMSVKDGSDSIIKRLPWDAAVHMYYSSLRAHVDYISQIAGDLDCIILDRFQYSIYAYQGALRPQLDATTSEGMANEKVSDFVWSAISDPNFGFFAKHPALYVHMRRDFRAIEQNISRISADSESSIPYYESLGRHFFTQVEQRYSKAFSEFIMSAGRNSGGYCWSEEIVNDGYFSSSENNFAMEELCKKLISWLRGFQSYQGKHWFRMLEHKINTEVLEISN